MEEIASLLSDYAVSLKYSDISEETIVDVKRRILDTLGCAIAAFNAEPVRIARGVALDFESRKPATILGTMSKSTPDMAAFVNVTMGRYLDFNDAYDSYGGGHPSDSILACLSVADSMQAGGEDFLLSVVLAYEIQGVLGDLIDVSEGGWDLGILSLIATTISTAKLMSLSCEATTQALNISLNAHIAMGQSRKGVISMWKGCSSAEATRCAIFSTMLASQGMTGPSPIFEGERGFFKQISGPFNLNKDMFGKNVHFKIRSSRIKLFPAVNGAHPSILAAIEAKKKISSLSDISRIDIATTRFSFNSGASNPIKWAPTTRETADHSIPYLVALALIDGTINGSTFTEDKITDEKTRDFMKKITVKEDPALTAEYPNKNPTVMKVHLKSGGIISQRIDFPKSSEMDQPSDLLIEDKFRHNTRNYFGQDQADKVISITRKLEEMRNLRDLFEACIVS